jgi:hypothetical protein
VILNRGQSLQYVPSTTIRILDLFMNKKVIITLTNGQSDYDLQFGLLDCSIAHKWLKHLELFIEAGQPWDDSRRFYNFPNTAYPESVVVEHLKHLITTIRDYAPDIITREPGTTITQDDLNYWHHVFEVYHGLYDQQDSNKFFCNAPKEVQDALADLNIWIHRYETLGGMPRFVGTWKYKPYRDDMDAEDYELFALKEEWGDLQLNYCEIGKSLYDLWNDNDAYIASEAFQPFAHFCFDFTVRFTNITADEYQDQEQQIWTYFDNHKDFFQEQGYIKHDPRLALGSITIAKLESTQSKQTVIDLISQHQQFKNIKIV